MQKHDNVIITMVVSSGWVLSSPLGIEPVHSAIIKKQDTLLLCMHDWYIEQLNTVAGTQDLDCIQAMT